MTRDEIIGIAREAGGGLSCIAEPLEHPWKFSESELIRFAALVAAAERDKWMERTAILIRGEREACALLCEDEADRLDETSGYGCATAIRARN